MTNDDDACVMQTPHAKQLLILTSPHFHLSPLEYSSYSLNMSNAKDNVNVSFDDDKMNHISGLKTKFLGFVCFTLLGWLLLLVVLSMLLGCIYYPKTLSCPSLLYIYTRHSL